MLRKEIEAVPEGNGPIPQDTGKMITWKELRRVVKETWGQTLKEIKKDVRSIEQRVTRLEHIARQSRLAMKAGGPTNTKTHERTKGASTAVQTMHGDSCSATRVDPGPKTNSTSLGMKAEPPALPCREDIMVENRAAAPKSCLPSLEIRSPTVAGGLLPTGKTSKATKITINKPPLRLYSTEETNSKETNL